MVTPRRPRSCSIRWMWNSSRRPRRRTGTRRNRSSLLRLLLRAAGLRDELDLADDHLLVDSLAHVVDRERSNGHGGQGFHFDAGLGGDSGDGFDVERDRLGMVWLELGEVEMHFDALDGKRMAEGDEVATSLGGHDPGNASGIEDLTLGGFFFGDGAEGGGGQRDIAFGDGLPSSGGFGPDVDHSGLAFIIEMAEGVCHSRPQYPFPDPGTKNSVPILSQFSDLLHLRQQSLNIIQIQ